MAERDTPSRLTNCPAWAALAWVDAHVSSAIELKRVVATLATVGLAAGAVLGAGTATATAETGEPGAGGPGGTGGSGSETVAGGEVLPVIDAAPGTVLSSRPAPEPAGGTTVAVVEVVEVEAAAGSARPSAPGPPASRPSTFRRAS